ncbi:hypothetical protein HKCCE2091_04245 [Rhodobacterales bacterium HKCCE2091]|nr:hypothetical protein [Rhodobacterales bacterium HKCCE2091]
MIARQLRAASILVLALASPALADTSEAQDDSCALPPAASGFPEYRPHVLVDLPLDAPGDCERTEEENKPSERETCTRGCALASVDHRIGEQ